MRRGCTSTLGNPTLLGASREPQALFRMVWEPELSPGTAMLLGVLSCSRRIQHQEKCEGTAQRFAEVQSSASSQHGQPKHLDRICTQTSVSFPHQQRERSTAKTPTYGSPDWHSQYAVARNTIEGLNGYVKVGPEQLASPERRRIRGRTAQHVLTRPSSSPQPTSAKSAPGSTTPRLSTTNPTPPGHVKKRAAARKRRASLREHLPLPPDR